MKYDMHSVTERLKDFAAIALADGRKDMSKSLTEIAAFLEEKYAD